MIFVVVSQKLLADWIRLIPNLHITKEYFDQQSPILDTSWMNEIADDICRLPIDDFQIDSIFDSATRCLHDSPHFASLNSMGGSSIN